MTIILSSVNYLAVIVSAIAAMVLGALWYGPLFGKSWMSASGMTDKKLKEMKSKGMGKSYVLNFISTLVMAYILALFVGITGATTAMAGIALSFWIWLGFMATLTLGSVLWEGRSAKLYFLNNAYNLISLAVMGAILAAWA